MSASNQFDRSGLSGAFPQHLDGDEIDRHLRATGEATRTSCSYLQASSWEDSTRSTFIDNACKLLLVDAVNRGMNDRAAASTPSMASVAAMPIRHGACYLRTPDDSADQDLLLGQFERVLRQARKHNVRIPLDRVFIDVGPRDESTERPGYISLASLVDDRDSEVSVIYVSDFNCLNRCPVLSGLFCEFAQRIGKTVYSVAEGSTR